MSKEQNIVLGPWMGEAGNRDGFDGSLVPDVLDHDRDPGPGAGFRDVFAVRRTALPDLRIAVEHLGANDDNVASACVIDGTQHGGEVGIAPTEQPTRVRGTRLWRLRDGLIVER